MLFDDGMGRSLLAAFALAGVAAIILYATGGTMIFMGYPAETLFWVVLAESVTIAAIVAAVDQSNVRGYIFDVLMFVVLVQFGIRSQGQIWKGSTVIGFSFPVTAAIAYWFKYRRLGKRIEMRHRAERVVAYMPRPK